MEAPPLAEKEAEVVLKSGRSETGGATGLAGKLRRVNNKKATASEEKSPMPPRAAVLTKPAREAAPNIRSCHQLTFEDLLTRKASTDLFIQRTYERPLRPPSLPAGPVVDPQTKMLDPDRMVETIDRAMFLVPDLPADATRAEETARGRLLGDLLQMRAVALINRTHDATPVRKKQMAEMAKAGSKSAGLLVSQADGTPDLKKLYEGAGRFLADTRAGTFDRDAAGELLAALCQPLPSTSTEVQRAAHARVTATLKTLWEMNETPAMLPDEQGMGIRHVCKAAAASAARLSSMVGPHTGTGQQFQALAGVLTEMKRAHLTRAAPYVSDEYSLRQAARLNWASPGLGERRSGAVLSSYKGGSLAYGHNIGIARVNGGLALGSNEFYFNDDEKGLYAQTYGTVALNFTSKVGFEGAAAARFNARAALNTGGLGVGTPMVGNHNIVEVVKLLDQFNADAAWGRKSADPWVNDTVVKYQKARNFVSLFLGRRYAREPGAPLYLTETKLEKGLNSTKARILATDFDRIGGVDAGDSGLKALVDTAYPPVQDLMQDALRARPAREMAQLPQHGIHNTVVQDTYYGHTHQPVGSATAVADMSMDFGLKSSRGFKATLETGADVVFFPNWWPNAPHKVLDPKYSHDVSENFRILKSLDDLVIGANEQRPVPPDLNLYAAIGARLSGEPLKRAEPLVLNDSDNDYFRGTFDIVQAEMDRREAKPPGQGLRDRLNDWWDTGLYAVKKDKKSVAAPSSWMARLSRGKAGEKALPPDEPVPAQFHQAILNPGVDPLLRVSEVCQFLGDMRFEMVELSQHLLARPNDVHLSPAQRAALTRKRQAAFETLNRQVWGGTYPGGLKAAMSKPEDFVARTFAALSTAFGLAGVHLSILKRQLNEKPRAPDEDLTPVMAAIISADENYQMARMLFDHDNLGIGNQKLLTVDRSTLEIYQMFRKITANSTKLTLSGGSTLDVLNQIAGAEGRSTLDIPDPSPDAEHPENNTKGAVFVTSNLGNVSVSARARYQILDYQDAPARQGTYWQFDIAATGGPLAGPALQKLLEKLVNKMAGTKSNPANEQLAFDRKGLDELIKQVQGTVLSVNEGTQVGIRLRKAPGHTKYKLQYVRPLMIKNSGLDISADIYTPFGVFTPGLTNTEFVAAPGFQRVGRDLYILLKQHANLKDAVDRAVAPRPDDPEAVRPDVAPPLPLAESVANARAERLAHELGDEIQANYFSSNDLLTQTISDYWEAIHAPENPPLKNNEFHRFYHQGRFGRLARIGKDVENFAPGSKFQALGNPFTAGENAWNTPIPLPAGLDEARWRELKREIEALPDDRARKEFFCNDPRGRSVLGTFLQILQTTNQVESASAVHHNPQEKAGFYSAPAPRLQKQLDRDNKNRRKGLPSQPPLVERFKARAHIGTRPSTRGREEIEAALQARQAGGLPPIWERARTGKDKLPPAESSLAGDKKKVTKEGVPPPGKLPVAERFAKPESEWARVDGSALAAPDLTSYERYFSTFDKSSLPPLWFEEPAGRPALDKDIRLSTSDSDTAGKSIDSAKRSSKASMLSHAENAMLAVVPDSAGRASQVVSQMFDWASRKVPGLREERAPDTDLLLVPTRSNAPSSVAGIVITQLGEDFEGDNNPDTMAAVGQLHPRLLKRLADADVVAMPNSASGLDCLLLSLLQALEPGHVETKTARARARHMRATLKLKEGMLGADSLDIPRILAFINSHYRPAGHPPLSLNLVTPRVEGDDVYPLVERVLERAGDNRATMPVSVLQGSNHYQLLVMKPPGEMANPNPVPQRTNL